MSSDLHLAQVNVARMNAPLDSAEMADFVARIAEINALADAAPASSGAWRPGRAMPPTCAPTTTIASSSTCRSGASVDDLRAYVYGSAHTEVMRRRHRWFSKFEGAYLALWWVPAGHVPSIEEAKARLAHLDSEGPSPAAFTFKQLFAPPA